MKKSISLYRPQRITATLIKRLAAAVAPDRPREIRDCTSGLILRHQPSGYLGLYADLGRGQREQICKATRITDTQDGMTMAIARSRAIALRGMGAEGHDFKKERQRRRAVPTLKEWLDETDEKSYAWWVVRNRKDGKNALSRMKFHFLPILGKRRIDAITPAHLEVWRTKRLDKAKRETINREAGALRACLAKTLEWKILDHHPLEGLRPLRVDRHRRVIRPLTDVEVEALREQLAKREEKLRRDRRSANAWRARRGYDLLPTLDEGFADELRPAVELSLETGLRRGECLGLLWEWVNFRNAMIVMPGDATKSYQTREIPLSALALNVLETIYKQQGEPDEGPVFRRKDGSKYYNMKRSLYAALKAAGIRRRSPEGRIVWHSLRHTFGSRLGAAGVDAQTLRELMGHANLQTTQRYLKSDRDRKRAAVKLL
ncbi:tyrosine-type recombinase/integrase [Lentisalinibacter salinarum]|uniref:tyrosine-type recombinase/integrase n=1 Tax=Lentisalinibacter salinarum TaxID=2992239 RepID=UPI003869667D